MSYLRYDPDGWRQQSPRAREERLEAESKARARMAEVDREEEAKNKINVAISNYDIPALRLALEEAKSAGVYPTVIRKGEAIVREAEKATADSPGDSRIHHHHPQPHRQDSVLFLGGKKRKTKKKHKKAKKRTLRKNNISKKIKNKKIKKIKKVKK